MTASLDLTTADGRVDSRPFPRPLQAPAPIETLPRAEIAVCAPRLNSPVYVLPTGVGGNRR